MRDILNHVICKIIFRKHPNVKMCFIDLVEGSTTFYYRVRLTCDWDVSKNTFPSYSSLMTEVETLFDMLGPEDNERIYVYVD